MALGPNLTKTSGRAQSFLSFTLCKTEQDCIQGDFVECGVWAGGNIIIARKTNPNIFCWAFDTFSGMTKPTAKDKKRGGAPAMFSYLAEGAKGWSSKSVIEVRKNLWDSGVLDEDKIRFIEGPVEETLLIKENLPKKISVLRLDTDWYESTKIELEILYPLLSPGGFLIVDDYGHWEGARAAVDEFFGMQIMQPVDYTVHFMVKP